MNFNKLKQLIKFEKINLIIYQSINFKELFEIYLSRSHIK